jgi:DNA-binding response OmpR family regulator
MVADGSSPPHAGETEAGPRVLLVEDIEGVRQILKNLLEIHEFRVIPAATAEDALELAKVRRFDVLLTDVALPGSGPELARDLRRLQPGPPVLFMSGHPPHSIDPRDLNEGAFLQKPFSAATLVQRLNELIGARSSHS